jgi:hypothetical protein
LRWAWYVTSSVVSSCPSSSCFEHICSCTISVPLLLQSFAQTRTDHIADAQAEWEDSSHFDSFVASDNFETFKTVVKPHSAAPPVPQLYNTDFEPTEVFASALTEAWQVKIGDSDGKVAETRDAWERFVSAVVRAGGASGRGIHGTSLNLEERRWVGVLGWESMEVSLKCLNVLVEL